MFTVIFHDEAEKEFTALPAAIRAKMDLYQKIAKNAPGRNRSGTSQTGGNAE